MMQRSVFDCPVQSIVFLVTGRWLSGLKRKGKSRPKKRLWKETGGDLCSEMKSANCVINT